jgi:hypothetical protein
VSYAEADSVVGMCHRLRRLGPLEVDGKAGIRSGTAMLSVGV